MKNQKRVAKNEKMRIRGEKAVKIVVSFMAILFVGFVLAGPTLAASEDSAVAALLERKGIATPEEYAKWLKRNIFYRKDKGGDVWSSPAETLKREYGDCEDYAFLSEEVLRRLNYEPQVLAIVGKLNGRSHAICVFKKDGRYMWFDNSVLKGSYVATRDQLNAYLTAAYCCSGIREIDKDSSSKYVTAGVEQR